METIALKAPSVHYLHFQLRTSNVARKLLMSKQWILVYQFQLRPPSMMEVILPCVKWEFIVKYLLDEQCTALDKYSMGGWFDVKIFVICLPYAVDKGVSSERPAIEYLSTVVCYSSSDILLSLSTQLCMYEPLQHLWGFSQYRLVFIEMWNSVNYHYVRGKES